jgi:hypothetical protein
MQWARARRSADPAARTRREMSLGINLREDVSSQALRAPRGVGIGLGMRRTEQAASAPRPALPGRSVSAPQGRRWNGSAGRTREGASAPKAGSLRDASSRRQEERGPPGSAKRAGRSRTAGSGERPALRKAALERDDGWFPSPETGRGGQTEARSPWGSGPNGGRNVRRLLRIGSQAGSRGVRRCLAGHSHGPSRDRAT